MGIVGVDEGGGDAVAWQGVAQQIERAPVYVLGGHDMVTGLRDVTHGVLHGRSTRGDRQSRGAPFERCDAVFEHPLCRIGQSPVDVARVGQTESGLGVVEVVEYIAGRLVDRHCTGVAGRVCALLADMQLQCLEMVWCVGFLCAHGVPYAHARCRASFSSGDPRVWAAD